MCKHPHIFSSKMNAYSCSTFFGISPKDISNTLSPNPWELRKYKKSLRIRDSTPETSLLLPKSWLSETREGYC